MGRELYFKARNLCPTENGWSVAGRRGSRQVSVAPEIRTRVAPSNFFPGPFFSGYLGVLLLCFAGAACSSDGPGFLSEDELPDVEDTPEPSEAMIVITEILANPDGVGDAEGEWFELYNAGASIDLDGFTVSDASGDSFEITGLTIEKRQYVVLGRDALSTENGGVLVDYNYSDDFTLANADESVILTDASGALVDSVSYSKAPTGASLSLDPNATNATLNDDPENFCASKYSLLESGDLGTPGLENDPCVIVGDEGALIITEFMANPDAVADERGEYIEIYNASSEDIRLDGWIISDGMGGQLEINSHGELSIASRAYVVLGNHYEGSENGGIEIDLSWEGALSLDDSGAILSIIAGETVVDEVDYGDVGFPSVPTGVSLQLDSNSYDATSNDDGSNWCKTDSSYQLSGGDYGTPGDGNDSCSP